MSAHTPGPWSINPRFADPIIGYDPLDGGPLIPVVSKIHGRDNKMIRANVNLISAAPDLLDALRCAVYLLRRWYDDANANETVAYQSDLSDHPKIAPLLAAIATAEGKS